jgi:hypothetical protein
VQAPWKDVKSEVRQPADVGENPVGVKWHRQPRALRGNRLPQVESGTSRTTDSASGLASSSSV